MTLLMKFMKKMDDLENDPCFVSCIAHCYLLHKCGN